MKILAIIPSRYASTRFPGKPLALVKGVPMVVRVYRRAASVFDDVCVATDDERIYDAVKAAGGEAVMTSDKHNSGTDRCLEALQKYSAQTDKKFDVVVNVQGDEPFISPLQLRQLADCFNDPRVEIATLVKKAVSASEVTDPNRPKVVLDKEGFALYFSRSEIPYNRNFHRDAASDGCGGGLTDEAVADGNYLLHIGLYGYRCSVLEKICSLPQSFLEKTESLEQLRWLENGFKIKVALSSETSYGIDTPEDLEKINAMNNLDLD